MPEAYTGGNFCIFGKGLANSSVRKIEKKRKKKKKKKKEKTTTRSDSNQKDNSPRLSSDWLTVHELLPILNSASL